MMGALAVARPAAHLSPPERSWTMDVVPDYDASDEIEYFFNALAWGLRGDYPPPAYPPG